MRRASEKISCSRDVGGCCSRDRDEYRAILYPDTACSRDMESVGSGFTVTRSSVVSARILGRKVRENPIMDARTSEVSDVCSVERVMRTMMSLSCIFTASSVVRRYPNP